MKSSGLEFLLKIVFLCGEMISKDNWIYSGMYFELWLQLPLSPPHLTRRNLL